MNNQNELALTKDDFAIFGDATVGIVREKDNYNLINRGKGIAFWRTFSIGDDITTYRDITIGSTKDQVFEKYGKSVLFGFEPYDDYLLYSTLCLHEYRNGNDKDIDAGDFKNIKGDEKWVEYSYEDSGFNKVYYIRFYFDSDDKVVLIGFYNLNTEDAETKRFNELCQIKNALLGPKYKVLYDIQYKTLPQAVLRLTEATIKGINDKKNFVYDLIKMSYKGSLNMPCPYKKKDIEVANKVLYVDEEIFNMTIIRFKMELKGILSKAIFIVYDNEFKNPRYFTAERDEFGDDENYIHFCEVYKDGRQNYCQMNYDENAIEKAIIDIYTDKVATMGMVTHHPKAKAKKREINVNDEAWIGVRISFIKNWKKYEPDSKIKNVEGMLIFTLEEGSPFKKCNLSFDTANFLVKFDGVKLTNVDEFKELLKKHKPKDKVIVTINTYDAEMDKFLSSEHKIELGSKNEETYQLVPDLETITPKMDHYFGCLNAETA